MLKWQEIEQENSCFRKANLHERLFVLLGRDEAAPETIRFWVKWRIKRGKNKKGDSQTTQALDCAALMEIEQANAAKEKP